MGVEHHARRVKLYRVACDPRFVFRFHRFLRALSVRPPHRCEASTKVNFVMVPVLRNKELDRSAYTVHKPTHETIQDTHSPKDWWRTGSEVAPPNLALLTAR